MPKFGSRLVIGSALTLCLLSSCATLPTFQVGVPYLIVWGYGVGPGGPIAYREVLIIDRVGRGGWVYARNPGDPTVWAVRLSGALQVTKLPDAPPPQPESYRSQR